MIVPPRIANEVYKGVLVTAVMYSGESAVKLAITEHKLANATAVSETLNVVLLSKNVEQPKPVQTPATELTMQSNKMTSCDAGLTREMEMLPSARHIAMRNELTIVSFMGKGTAFMATPCICFKCNGSVSSQFHLHNSLYYVETCFQNYQLH